MIPDLENVFSKAVLSEVFDVTTQRLVPRLHRLRKPRLRHLRHQSERQVAQRETVKARHPLVMQQVALTLQQLREGLEECFRQGIEPETRGMLGLLR